MRGGGAKKVTGLRNHVVLKETLTFNAHGVGRVLPITSILGCVSFSRKRFLING